MKKAISIILAAAITATASSFSLSLEKPEQDTPMAVLACFMAAKDQGPDFIFNDENGCEEQIKKACKFKRKDGRYRLRAMDGVSHAACMTFMPFLI